MLLSNVVALCVSVCLAGAHREALLWAAICNTIRERESIPKFYYPRHTRKRRVHIVPGCLSLSAAAPIRSCCNAACCSSFFFILLFLKKRRRRRGDDDDLGLSFLDVFETRRALKPVQLLFKISLSLFYYIVVSSSHAITTTLESWRRGRPFVSFDWRFCLGSNAVKVWND